MINDNCYNTVLTSGHLKPPVGDLEEDGFIEGVSLGFPESISLGDTLVVGPAEEDGGILGCDVTLRQWKNPAPLNI